MVPRDTYASIPVPRVDRRGAVRSLARARRRGRGHRRGAQDGHRRHRPGAAVQRRRPDRRRSRRNTAAPAANPRVFAHTIADEIHKQQRNLTGVARTKLTFSSDRDGERMQGTVYEPRHQGDLHRRLRRRQPAPDHGEPLAEHQPGLVEPTARRSPTRSYRRNNLPDIFVQRIYEGTPPESPAHGTDRVHNFLPAWSPDGTRIAFMTNRDGNPEIYVMDATAANLRRITRHPGIDATPTWSPAGNQIAFTSDRSGSPQIYIVDADGLEPAAAHHDGRELGRPRDLGAGAVQRDCLRGAHPGPASTSRSTTSPTGAIATAHRRRGIEREPGVLADRPPPRLRVDPRRATSRSSSSAATATVCAR